MKAAIKKALYISGLALTAAAAVILLLHVLHTDRQLMTSSGEYPPAGDRRLIWYLDGAGYERAWGRDVVSKRITEQTGLRVDFLSGTDSPDSYLPILMAGNSMPDIITLKRDSYQIIKLINEKAVIELDKAPGGLDLSAVDPVYLQFVEKNRVDGRLYFLPGAVSGGETDGLYNLQYIPALLVRSDVYNVLGRPSMTTPEGFLDTLRGAAARGLFPLGFEAFNDAGCGSVDEALAEFLAIPGYVQGTAYDRIMDEDFLTWLLCLSRAYREGLLDRSMFIDSSRQVADKVAEGSYFAYMGNVAWLEQSFQAARSGNITYESVEPPRNSRDESPVIPRKGQDFGLYATMVTAGSPRVQDALALISYMAGPQGQSDIYIGKEGVMWNHGGGSSVAKTGGGSNAVQTGGSVILPRLEVLRNNSLPDYNKVYGGYSYYFMLSCLESAVQFPAFRSSVLSQPYAWYSRHAVSRTTQRSIDFQVNTRYIRQEFLIRQQWGSVLPTLLTAESDKIFYDRINAFVKLRSSLGFDEIQQEKTRLWQESGMRYQKEGDLP